MSGAALSPMQRRGLVKLGDVLIPGDGDMPSFAETNCIDCADRMLAHMYDDDRSGVKGVATLCALLPRPLIRALFALTERHATLPEPLAGLLRMANVGAKGVVMTLYYSDVGTGGILAKIGWDAVVHGQTRDDLDDQPGGFMK